MTRIHRLHLVFLVAARFSPAESVFHGHSPHSHAPNSHTPLSHTPHTHYPPPPPSPLSPPPSPPPPPPPPPSPPSPPPLWSIVSGADSCELSSEGTCVTDGAGDYGNYENCEVRADVALTYTISALDTEADFDWLTIQGTQYSGSGPVAGSALMAVGETFTWQSDESAVRTGWEVCGTLILTPPSDGGSTGSESSSGSHVVRSTFRVSGDVSDFDASVQIAMRRAIANAAGVDLSAVEIEIVSGSVLVTTEIAVSSESDANVLSQALTSGTGIFFNTAALHLALSSALPSGASVTAITTAPRLVTSTSSGDPPSCEFSVDRVCTSGGSSVGFTCCRPTETCCGAVQYPTGGTNICCSAAQTCGNGSPACPCRDPTGTCVQPVRYQGGGSGGSGGGSGGSGGSGGRGGGGGGEGNDEAAGSLQMLAGSAIGALLFLSNVARYYFAMRARQREQ